MTHKRFTTLLLAALLTMLAVASMPAHAQTAEWKVSYYNNIFLTDPPALDTTATQLIFDWGSGSPSGAVNNNNWSARYGTDVYFTAATYRFTVRADDEVRVWIDYNAVLSTFDAAQPGAVLTVDVPLTTGSHHLQVDYRERTGSANLSVTWQDVRTVGLTLTPTAVTSAPTGITATVVNAYVLNVRNAPGTSGLVLTKVLRNQAFGVVGKNADSTWYKLDVNGQQGWASAAYLLVSNPSAVPVVDGTSVTPVVVSSDVIVRTPVRLNLRTGPSTSFSSSEVLPAGSLLKVIGRNGDSSWLKVDYAGRQGWVALAFIQSVTPMNFMTIPVVG